MADIDVDRYQGPLREATPNGHVGFDSLPDQVVNKVRVLKQRRPQRMIKTQGDWRWILLQHPMRWRDWHWQEYTDEHPVQYVI